MKPNVSNPTHLELKAQPRKNPHRASQKKCTAIRDLTVNEHRIDAGEPGIVGLEEEENRHQNEKHKNRIEKNKARDGQDRCVWTMTPTGNSEDVPVRTMRAERRAADNDGRISREMWKIKEGQRLPKSAHA